jgi:hypothetical protein
MSEESIRIIAEFVGGIFLVYITHYLTKSHYEKKREDELEDRTFGRHALVHDRQIQQARDYVDQWSKYLFRVNEINSKVLQATSVDDIQRVMKMESYNQLVHPFEELARRAHIFNILNDEELSLWNEKFVPNLITGIKYLLAAIDITVLSNKLDINKNILLELDKSCKTSFVAVARMKYKLDELERNFK